MKILIDNGHGLNTPGKRSPDGKFLEAIYTREIAKRIVTDLIDRGYDAELLVPETEDISLEDRVSRVNAHCRTHGKSNVILVSIHVNAAGNGSKWLDATGWSCYTSKGETQSDRLATCLYDAAAKYFHDRKIRTDYVRDGDPDLEEDFYLLRKSHCVAVLSENFFMDNRSDLEYLQSRSGMQSIIDAHVEGIIEYLIYRQFAA